MADSQREKNMKVVKTLIEAITIANGYNHDIGDVFRKGVIVEDTVSDYPAVIIYEDFEDASDETFGPTGLSHLENRLRVVLDCWIENADATFETLNLLLADVQKAIMSDRTLGGNAMDVRLISNEMLLNEPVLPVAGVSQIIEVRYRQITTDPFNC